MSTLTSRNPATGDVVGEVAITPEDQIDAVVKRAAAARGPWARKSLAERADCLRPAGKLIAERADQLGELLCREMGKPLAEARGEIQWISGGFERELGEMVSALADEIVEDRRSRSTIKHDGFGVAAVISPWNFPFAMPHSMILPALMAGNAVVLKPSEQTPLIAQAYVEILCELLPADLLQIVHGADAQGKALVESDVDLIAFTGSRGAGIHIMGAASRGLKRVVLELGGKDPMIVLPDADLPKAAKFAAQSSFRNAGQVCVSTERIYVHASIADRFVELVVDAASTLTQGDGMVGGTRVGPMISAQQRDHVLAQIDAAVASGATIVYGGEKHHDLFVQPTVLTGVTHEMAIAVEETFGPVACIMVVADAQEAIGLANDTAFGLGATVFGSTEAATAVAGELTAGMIGVNQGCGGATGTPWVGARQSGYGFHSSPAGHRQFAQTRVITMSI